MCNDERHDRGVSLQLGRGGAAEVPSFGGAKAGETRLPLNVSSKETVSLRGFYEK